MCVCVCVCTLPHIVHCKNLHNRSLSLHVSCYQLICMYTHYYVTCPSQSHSPFPLSEVTITTQFTTTERHPLPLPRHPLPSPYRDTPSPPPTETPPPLPLPRHLLPSPYRDTSSPPPTKTQHSSPTETPPPPPYLGGSPAVLGQHSGGRGLEAISTA